MPPQVRDLQALIAEYGKAYDPQQALINADIATNDASGVAQEQGLQAKQGQAFKTIEQGAQKKGMYFSGFSPNEQANYTSDTYLPALAQLQATIAATRGSLLGKKADIQTSIYDKAFNTREGDVKAKNDWQSEQERRAYQAEQDRINREFQASENAKQRSASAASSRASSGPSLSIAKNSAGGYNVLEDGQVSQNYDLAAYAQLTGKDLINLLANGDAQDRQAAKWYNDNIRLGRGQSYALDRLMNYDRPTAFYKGGGYGS